MCIEEYGFQPIIFTCHLLDKLVLNINFVLIIVAVCLINAVAVPSLYTYVLCTIIINIFSILPYEHIKDRVGINCNIFINMIMKKYLTI